MAYLRVVWVGLALAFMGAPTQAAQPLNDTGITTYGNATSNTLPTEPADYPGQDASHGRDAAAQAGTLAKIGGGRVGFDFTKLDASGNDLPASATDWTCVRDNVTGLIWEIKTDDGGLRDQDNTYTWYNPDSTTNGGSAGTPNSGYCPGGIGCDTYGYAQAVNDQGLCGRNDWRLPAVEELRSLVDYSIPYPGPTIDTNYFPNTPAYVFWSASPYADHSDYAWGVDFNFGSDGAYGKVSTSPGRVRLVHGGQSWATLAADLSVTLLDDEPDPVVAGEHLTYEVVVHNDGPDEANGAVLTVTLPAGVTFVSGGTLFGLGPPCSAASGVDDTTVVTCPFDIVPAGSNTYAEIVVIPDAAGVLTTQASVTSGAGDPVAGNNTATASTLVDGLLFPLQGREPDTAIINAVLDHSSTLPYAKDGRIELASGEVASCDVGARKYSAVAKKTGVPAGTIVAVPAGGCGDLRDGKVGSNGWLYEYQVAGSEEWVSYDGHPGYDFKAAAGEPILATTGGTLCVATSDTVPPAPNEQKVWRHPAKCPFGDDPINAKGKNAWKEWHVFYIIPEGGGSSSLTTWYLHADDFSDGVRAAVRSQGFAEVAEGAEVAWVGGCCKNLGPHLHFEVREGNDTGVDPYGWKGSPVLWK